MQVGAAEGPSHGALVPVGRCQLSHPQGRAPEPVSLPESCPGLVGAQGCSLAWEPLCCLQTNREHVASELSDQLLALSCHGV